MNIYIKQSQTTQNSSEAKCDPDIHCKIKVCLTDLAVNVGTLAQTRQTFYFIKVCLTDLAVNVGTLAQT